MSAAGEIGDGVEAMSSPLALHLLGILFAHEGRYDEAEEAFLRAVEADPEMAGSYVELGLVYACRGEYTKMVEALRQAVDIGRSAGIPGRTPARRRHCHEGSGHTRTGLGRHPK